MNFRDTVKTQKPEKIESINEGKFGAKLATYKNGWRAVIKSVDTKAPSGKSEFRGVPLKTVPYREVAFYKLSKMLGWSDLVPETVLTKINGVTHSAQLFIPSVYLRDLDKSIFDKDDPKRLLHLRKLAKTFPRDEWRRMILMDLIANNRDRHGRNVIVRMPGPHLVAIDNSIAFGKSFRRYRNIFHRHLFSDAFRLTPYMSTLKSLNAEKLAPLAKYISPSEIAHILMRRDFLMEYPYRVPFKVLSKGIKDGPFPSYSRYFRQFEKESQPLVISPDQGFREPFVRAVA